MRVLNNIILIVAAHACIGTANAQTFDFTVAKLIDNFNNQLKLDGGDTIKTCKKSALDTICIFNDTSFQKSVTGFKKLNLANGTFSLKEKLLISEINGKVSMFLVEGDRGDPMSLFHFAGQLGSMLSALNPSLTTDDVTKEVLSLGVMRGDDDPSIGQPKIDILEFAEIRCNNQQSRVDTIIGCAFLPRS
jgi:hypothetical protein